MMLVTLDEKFADAVLPRARDKIISTAIQFRKVSWQRAPITVPNAKHEALSSGAKEPSDSGFDYPQRQTATSREAAVPITCR